MGAHRRESPIDGDTVEHLYQEKNRTLETAIRMCQVQEAEKKH